MQHTTKETFIGSLLTTMTEAVQKQETLYQRGFITETEKIAEIAEIINKTQELIMHI